MRDDVEAPEKFDGRWRGTTRVALVSRGDVDHLIKKHYLGKWPGVCVLSLGMFVSDVAVGVIVFALPPRETQKRYGGGVCWELARLWIDDSIPRNAETFLISKAVKYIKKNHPDVCVLVSYADPSAGHSGVIYKAANWICDGRTDQERKTPRFDYSCAKTGKKFSRRKHVPAGTVITRIPRVSKFRFVYILKRRHENQ